MTKSRIGIGCVVLAAATLFAVPAQGSVVPVAVQVIVHVRETIRLRLSINAMGRLGVLVKDYADQNDGRMPTSLVPLIGEDELTATLLLSPYGSARELPVKAGGIGAWIAAGGGGLEYLAPAAGVGMRVEGAERMLLAYDREAVRSGRRVVAVLCVDGAAREWTIEQVRAAIAARKKDKP